MKNILIVSGHPNLDASHANRIIIDELARELPDADIRCLDQLYPDFRIDVAAEQAALMKADVIVWQFPLHWYNLPALMKKWLDDVFLFGFAFGTAHHLENKPLLASFTTGAAAREYAVGGAMNHPLDAFLPPVRQTALLCRMKFPEPVYSNGMTWIPGVHTDADLADVQTRAREHAARLLKQIESL